jgi:DNA repair exonuclease SbcCD ATPase subunit
MSEDRRKEGLNAARLAYDEGNGLAALWAAINRLVDLEERVEELEGEVENHKQEVKLCRAHNALILGVAKNETDELKARIEELEGEIELLREGFERAAGIDQARIEELERMLARCHEALPEDARIPWEEVKATLDPLDKRDRRIEKLEVAIEKAMDELASDYPESVVHIAMETLDDALSPTTEEEE